MMDEPSSTCFLSSFSQPPSPALEVNQGDPNHALSSSVSFGRYMSESLAWEKWSTFTHNRYKEEAQRYSKPGSVAEMKAYFEAHYKKKAAERAAAALNGQQNSETNLKTESCNIGVSLEMSSCTPCEKAGGAEDAQVLNNEKSLLADPVATHTQQNLVEDIQLCKSTPEIERKGLEDTPTVKADQPQLADCVDVQKPVRDVEYIGIDAANRQSKTPINGAGQLGDMGSLHKEKLAICSTKSRSRTGVPKPPVLPKPPGSLQKRRNSNVNLDQERTARISNPPVPPKPPISLQKRKPPVPPNQSVSLHKRKHNNANLDHKGNAADMADRKKTTSNASKVSHGKPGQDSVDISPDAAVTFQERKVSGSKSPAACGREARPPTVTRALIFKSEQRAAKRKQFFERLEEKAKVKMTEKEKLQEQTQVKEIDDPKPKSEYSKTSSNAMKKVSTSLPCSPTVGRKTPSKLQDISSQLPRHTTTTTPCSANASRTPSKLHNSNIQSPWRYSALTCSSTAGTKTPSKLQDISSRSPWRRSTLPCSSTAGTTTPSKLQDNNSRSPWRKSTLACSSSTGTKTPSKLQDNNPRSPWRQSTPVCSSAGRRTPSKLQDNIGRSPCSSSAYGKTHESRSPWRHATLVSSSSVDRKTPSRVQDSNSRPPWRLAAKSECYQQTIEKNNRSPFYSARSRSKKAHENLSPNIQPS